MTPAQIAIWQTAVTALLSGGLAIFAVREGARIALRDRRHQDEDRIGAASLAIAQELRRMRDALLNPESGADPRFMAEKRIEFDGWIEPSLQVIASVAPTVAHSIAQLRRKEKEDWFIACALMDHINSRMITEARIDRTRNETTRSAVDVQESVAGDVELIADFDRLIIEQHQKYGEIRSQLLRQFNEALLNLHHLAEPSQRRCQSLSQKTKNDQ